MIDFGFDSRGLKMLRVLLILLLFLGISPAQAQKNKTGFREADRLSQALNIHCFSLKQQSPSWLRSFFPSATMPRFSKFEFLEGMVSGQLSPQQQVQMLCRGLLHPQRSVRQEAMETINDDIFTKNIGGSRPVLLSYFWTRIFNILYEASKHSGFDRSFSRLMLDLIGQTEFSFDRGLQLLPLINILRFHSDMKVRSDLAQVLRSIIEKNQTEFSSYPEEEKIKLRHSLQRSLKLHPNLKTKKDIAEILSMLGFLGEDHLWYKKQFFQQHPEIQRIFFSHIEGQLRERDLSSEERARYTELFLYSLEENSSFLQAVYSITNHQKLSFLKDSGKEDYILNRLLLLLKGSLWLFLRPQDTERAFFERSPIDRQQQILDFFIKYEKAYDFSDEFKIKLVKILERFKPSARKNKSGMFSNNFYEPDEKQNRYELAQQLLKQMKPFHSFRQRGVFSGSCGDAFGKNSIK